MCIVEGDGTGEKQMRLRLKLEIDNSFKIEANENAYASYKNDKLYISANFDDESIRDAITENFNMADIFELFKDQDITDFIKDKYSKEEIYGENK